MDKEFRRRKWKKRNSTFWKEIPNICWWDAVSEQTATQTRNRKEEHFGTG